MKQALRALRGMGMGQAMAADATNPLSAAQASPSEKLSRVFANLDTHQPQILFTRVKRSKGDVFFESFTFNIDEERYFYPASSVKLPMALLAVEKLNALRASGATIDLNAAYRLTGQALSAIYPDPLEHSSTLATDIERIAVVSDNMAFNRLYDFVGPDVFEARVYELTGTRAQMSHRLAMGLTAELNRTQLGVLFASYPQCALSEQSLGPKVFGPPLYLGKGYIAASGQRVEQPFPVHRRNRLSLPALHMLLLKLVVPEAFEASEQLKINAPQRAWLLDVFSRLPRQSTLYQDQADRYTDAAIKYLMFGDRPAEPVGPDITIVNKVGQAYGFLIDSAYFLSEADGVEYLLSAVVYVNENEVFNDGVYEYEETGLPFLGALGRFVYAWEKDR